MSDQVTKSFKDDLGREWTVDITTATLLRVKALVGFSFDDLIGKPDKKNPELAAMPLEDFLDDGEKFANVLYAILKPDAERKGITQEQFHEGFRGEGTQNAVGAFIQALMDFSHNPAKRMVIRGVMMSRRSMKRAEMKAKEMVAKMEAEMTNEKIDAEIEKVFREQSSKVASALPESLEPTLSATP